MDWRLKCLALQLMRLPGGAALHRWAQRRLTGRAWRKITDPRMPGYSFHVENFRGGVALDFGSGRDLLNPLLLSSAGATTVYAFDIERLASIECINHVIRQLRELLVPGDWPEVSSFEDLERRYRIEYRAPGDMRSTGLAEGSVDFICSTSVLEHIPEPDIRRILVECARILSPTGVMSFVIDYKDHYAAADKRISPFNFYRYSERAWRWFNPPNHYQNRLRHSDFERLFRILGLQCESRRSIRELPEIDLATPFRSYSQEDLATGSGFFVLTSPRT